MKIIISGASGFVGTALSDALRARGDSVVHLVRRDPDDSSLEVRWQPSTGTLDPDAVSGADVVINLNGRSISDGRWTDAVKAELRSSRLESTNTLVQAIERAPNPPKLLVNASATGFYGDRGDRVVDETAAKGEGFLADLAADWEAAAARARSGTTRVALIRLGMVVGDGGALDTMLLPFKLGVGGPIGNGKQWWPWVAMIDVVGAVQHIIDRDDIDGPVNLVGPEPVTSREFARALGRQLGRPAFLPAPAFAVRAALGEMAEALLLASTNVRPAVLEDSGFRFTAPTVTEAFRLALD